MARPRKVPGTIDKRGDTHRVRLCVAGTRHVYTVKSPDRRVAEQFAIKKERELKAQAGRRAAGLITGMRISALVSEYEKHIVPSLADGTQSAYGDSLKIIKRYFIEAGEEEVFEQDAVLPVHRQDPTIDSIRATHIQSFMTWRRTHRLDGDSSPTHNRTIQKDRAVLHRIFEYADKLEYREGNPVGRVEAPSADERDPVILTDEQYEAMVLECADRAMLKLYVKTLAETGGRCKSEVLWLQWDDIDLNDAFMKIVTGRNGHRTKGGKARWVPMTPQLVADYRAHFARYRFAAYNGVPTPWIFHHEITRARHVAGARIRSLHRGFRSAARRAGLPEELHQHDLRHRRVTTWLAEGQDITKVKEAVGHSDIRTTMGYTHLAKEHLRSLVEQKPRAKPKAG
jgi:site-specific recombinase XerD